MIDCFHKDVTPLIITYNEELNIERVFQKLSWARRIVVVDSGSTDATLEILSKFPMATVIYRKFDSFAKQCNFGLDHIDTSWVLSMDADYVLSDSLVHEIQHLRPEDGIVGYRANFAYVIKGRPLRGSLYPPRVVLYRKEFGRYEDEGHGHRLTIDGPINALAGIIYHDDRKSLSRWLASQLSYAEREASMLGGSIVYGRLADRLRRTTWIMPLIVPFYVLFLKGGILNGRAGWIYCLERVLAEILIALNLLDKRVQLPPKDLV